MKFFWKVFFCTITVTIITFSVGSYLLINTLFNTSLEREIRAAFDENDMLRISFMMAAVNIPHNGNLSADSLQGMAQSMNINTSSGILPITISDENYTCLYTNSSIQFENAVLETLQNGNRGYEIVETEDKQYINTVCAEVIGCQTVYLGNVREITQLYITKTEQFHIVQKLMLGLIFINGILILGLSLWLTYPIKKLSQATKRMASGDLHVRLDIKSTDEIGRLSQDYNDMADTLEKNITELKEASERQEDFVGSFAHELKTPLTSMIGYADMLRSKKMSAEQNFMAANYIFQEGKRLEALSLKLMDMIVLKKQNFVLKKIPVVDLLESVQGVVQPVLESKNNELLLSAQDAVIYAEPDLMKTVCINLIDNAIKATDDGGQIVLTGECVEDGYRICIRDAGRGIPKEELSKITEAFYMVDKSRSRASGGAGLGLAICSEIIKLHQGKMTFESELGKGTTVTILLKEATI